MLGEKGRGAQKAVFGPIARWLVRRGVSPDAVTIAGTVVTAVVSFGLLARGHMVAGSLALGFVLVTDSIDGTMARAMGRNSRWGAFLDSTLDRVADACVYLSIALVVQRFDDPWQPVTYGFALAIVPLALIVSYARARAESVGVDAHRGLAERTDRLVVSLLGVLLVGFGLPLWVLTIALGYVAIASAITIGQRILAVKRAEP